MGTAEQSGSGEPLVPPEGGAAVRMYRTGHGDCFLLAFPGKGGARAHVLIDCGYKIGSPAAIEPPTDIKAITRHIVESTGGFIDVAVITHEHQDHVNGITDANFAGLSIGEMWLAWTDDPDDEDAKGLRRRYRDYLLHLLEVGRRLDGVGDAEGERSRRLKEFLAFEVGGTDDDPFDLEAAFEVLHREGLGLAGGSSGRWTNKRSMRVFKDLAAQNGHVRYLEPHRGLTPGEGAISIAGAEGVRVFVLGPPRALEKLRSLDPRDGEGFADAPHALSSPGQYFMEAVSSANGGSSPFSPVYALPMKTAANDPRYGSFVKDHYLGPGARTASSRAEDEVPSDADWRRIDTDWLHAADRLALHMSDYTNNTSLVLAFELGRGGKVLLFAADAQAGNWRSWADADWTLPGGEVVTARDLLARTVLYKVGHHGSHNATLKGTTADDYPNLGWMGEGAHGREFTAMITAVRKWAIDPKVGWDHPLPAIKAALMKKTAGRVFQTDTPFKSMERPEGTSEATWNDFQRRSTGTDLYFDYRIEP